MTEQVQEYLSNAEMAFASGQHEVALELCEKAIAEDPSHADSYSGAGRACLVLERLPDAEQYFQKAVDLDSTNGERYFDLGNIKFGLEKYPEALANYAKAEQLGCEDDVKQKLYYQTGMISYMTGDVKAAMVNFEKADDFGVVNEDTKEMLLQRIQVYIETQDFVRAENYAAQLKMLAPDEFRSYQLYFQMLIANNKYAQAEEVLVEAEKYSDIDSDILNKVDMCFNKALMYSARAEIEPENRNTHYESAIAIFDELAETPDLPQDVIDNIATSKAEIYLRIEDFDAALKCVEDISIEDEGIVEIESDADLTDEDEFMGEENLGEKVGFIKLTCYLGNEDFAKAVDFVPMLKVSKNEQYTYFGTYADAFIARKLAEEDASQADSAEHKYNSAIAFFNNKAFTNPLDLFATIFRIRLYAENGKYSKAEELIKILPDALKEELNKYVADCRAEKTMAKF